MSLIEKKFFEKINGNEDYQVLANYWNCVKEQVPRILSCISQVFPHYTMHDISHSKAILDCIERVLGSKVIESLSVTDLWLILCSAYYHDIGMNISGDEIEKCFKTEDFKNFILELQRDECSPLHKYAIFYELEDDKLKYKSCDLTLDSYHSARYLLAEFFRKKHADRSEKYVKTDEIVPQVFLEIKRLISIIAEICHLHGAKFEDVMKYQNCENGVTDYCHPRFVACMLRLGDLLDFDSSRVSRYLLEHLSSSIPEDSKIHNKKNLCIKHALITSEKVEVIAESDDIYTAFEIDAWFSWIREEMTNQRNLWSDIAPNSEARGFPKLGKLETHLLGHDIIDNNFKPRFEIDGKNAAKYFQGGGLYGEKNECIREILQNAIDATYIRIYLENKQFAQKYLEDGFKEFVNICDDNKYQIEVKYKKENGKHHFEIKDNGIGILKDELQYLLKIGSGRKNKKKYKIIDEMPEYAKPSGFFGIGFQSIFLITDKVLIETRSELDNEVICLQIGSPLKNGFAILKSYRDPFAKIGTTISFDLKDELVDIKKSTNHVECSNYYDDLSENYDFVENDVQDIEVTNILDEVYSVGKDSYLNILCQGKKTREKKINVDNLISDKDGTKDRIVQINPINSDISNRSRCTIYYRREHVKKHNISLKYINWDVNILYGQSDEFLMLNRDEIKAECEPKITEMIKKMGVQHLLKTWDRYDEKSLSLAARFIEYYGDQEQKNKKNLKDYWERIDFYGKTIKEIVRYDAIVLRSLAPHKSYGCFKNGTKLIVYQDFDDQTEFLAYVLKEKYGYKLNYRSYQDEEKDDKEKRIEIEFNKNNKGSVDWKSWIYFYESYIIGKSLPRCLMPCIGYENLEVKEPEKIVAGWDPMKIFNKITYPRTVCPLTREKGKIEWEKTEKLNKIYDWVYANRKNDSLTREDIVKEFEDMKKKIEPIIKEMKFRHRPFENDNRISL